MYLQTFDIVQARFLVQDSFILLSLRTWWLARFRPPSYPSPASVFCVSVPLSIPPLLLYFAEQGLDHIAENILSYLDARSLCAAELVCKEWQRVISEGMLWKKLIERMVRTDPLWKGLSERRGWWVFRLLVPLKHSFFDLGSVWVLKNVVINTGLMCWPILNKWRKMRGQELRGGKLKLLE